jgi:hypothetical protein
MNALTSRPVTTRPLQLQADSHFRLPLPGRWRIRCVEGRLWVTQAGELQDHVLQRGECRVFSGDASLLIGALQESRLHLEWLGPLHWEQIPGWRARLALFMRRCWQSPASRFHGSMQPLRHDQQKRESHRAERGVCGPFCEKLD